MQKRWRSIKQQYRNLRLQDRGTPDTSESKTEDMEAKEAGMVPGADSEAEETADSEEAILEEEEMEEVILEVETNNMFLEQWMDQYSWIWKKEQEFDTIQIRSTLTTSLTKLVEKSERC